MALSTITSKLNWRLIVVHFAACWFFYYAFQLLFILHDFKFISPLLVSSKLPRNVDANRIAIDAFWISMSNSIGLIIGLLVSLLISFKQHWFWLNSLIAFFMACLVCRFSILGWDYLHHIFLLPGRVFKRDNSLRFLTDGIFLLGIGMLLFFSRSMINFINSPPKDNIEPLAQPSGN